MSNLQLENLKEEDIQSLHDQLEQTTELLKAFLAAYGIDSQS
ncbi:MAG: hypothetical protein WCT28_04070 [Patescibacteria group bacterium]|jgi:hypothetical protein